METKRHSREITLISWLKSLKNQSDIKLKPLTNDASFRRYFRVKINDINYVVMDAPPEKEPLKSFIHVSQLLESAGVNAPKVWASDVNQGFLCLSDVGDDLYLSQLQHHPEQVDRLYGDALAALISLQACIDGQQVPAYDRVLLQQELALFPHWYLSVHLNYSPSSAQQQALQAVFNLLIDNALTQPQVFVHRDYHSRNLIKAAHNPAILDFQDAVCGAITYDLVSLLRDVYIQWPKAQVEDWALGYRELALQSGLLPQAPTEREFLRWFDWMGLQRHLKIAGIFARLYHRDGKAAYLNDIPLTLRYIQQVSATYPEMAFLHKLINDLA